MEIEEYKKLATLVRDDDRYQVYDLKIGDMTLSLTELKIGKTTRGHSHNNPEAYLFLDKGLLHIGPFLTTPMEEGDAMSIRPNVFHKVDASTDSSCRFWAIYIGERDKANYNSEIESL